MRRELAVGNLMIPCVFGRADHFPAGLEAKTAGIFFPLALKAPVARGAWGVLRSCMAIEALFHAMNLLAGLALALPTYGDMVLVSAVIV